MDNLEYVTTFETIFSFAWTFISFTVFAVMAIVVKSLFDSIRVNNQRKNFKVNVVDYENYKYRDLTSAKLTLLNNPNLSDLKDYLYDIFFQFETAYNRVDYGMMRALAMPNLYQNYHLLISLELKKGNKKVLDNIQRENVIVYDVMYSSYCQSIFAMIEVSYISYTLDKQGAIISGSRDNRITESFEVTFRQYFNHDGVVKCPNCGANVANGKCEYCRTDIKNEGYKIYSIKKIVK